MFDFTVLQNADPEVFAAINAEQQRQQDHIELIASENFTSRAVMEAQGSALTNKYAEGYPGARYYGGCEYVDVAEKLACKRVLQLFGGDHANVQPHSGTQANMAAYYALLQPGDKVLGMSLAHGGHLSHGLKANFSGRQYDFSSYGVDKETEMLDYDAIYDQAVQLKPRLIVVGASAYPRKIDFAKFREIADACGAMLMTDMAHIAGLVAADEHMNPVPYCDIVTSTTHKTLRGPRGGFIICREQYAKAVDKAVFPGLQGGPLMHVIAAKAVALGEALLPSFREYICQLRANMDCLCECLSADSKLRLVSGGSDNHLALADVRPLAITGKQAENMLSQVCITCNKNSIPFDPEKPGVTSGIRLGTAAITTRGFKEDDVRQMCRAIILCLEGGETKISEGRALVADLTDKHPLYA